MLGNETKQNQFLKIWKTLSWREKEGKLSASPFNTGNCPLEASTHRAEIKDIVDTWKHMLNTKFKSRILVVRYSYWSVTNFHNFSFLIWRGPNYRGAKLHFHRSLELVPCSHPFSHPPRYKDPLATGETETLRFLSSHWKNMDISKSCFIPFHKTLYLKQIDLLWLPLVSSKTKLSEMKTSIIVTVLS